MYNVSDAYKSQIFKDGRETDVVGTLTLKNGTVINIDGSTIAQKPEIDGQCSGNEDLILGQVYQSQLKVSLYSDTDRYSVYGAEIRLTYKLKLEDGSWEQVPLGVYIVSECIRKSNDVLQITALDSLNKLDVEHGGESVSGKPSDILNYVARKAGLELGQSPADLDKLINGSVLIGTPSNPNVNTLRDIVGDLSAVMGGFAIIDRNGRLSIRNFSTAIDRTISADYRKKESISDYKIKYSKVSCIKNSHYIFMGDNSKQELSLGENVFLQLGTDSQTRELLQNILNGLKDVEFTPTSFEFVGDPAIDLGDLINITGYGARASTLVPVHKQNWKWRGNHKIQAVGKNPYLNPESKETRAISSVTRQVKSVENRVLQMTNTKEVQVTDLWKELSDITFGMSTDQNLLFNGVCKVDMINDTTVKFKYENNSEEIDFIHEAQTGKGVNTITLFMPVTAKPNELNTFVVYIASDGIGSVDIMDFRGSISGSGLSYTEWDGSIILEDAFGRIAHFRCVGIIAKEEFNFTFRTPVTASASDTMQRVFKLDRVKTLEDDCRLTMKINEYTRIEEDEEETTRITEDGIIRTTIGGFALDGN